MLLRRTIGSALTLALIWTVLLTTVTSAAPINGTGTFKPSNGNCRGQRPFTDRFIFEVNGNQLTITQPSTKDVATGTINPDGTFHLSSKSEDYTGKVTGTDIQATYVQTDDACRATYDATFKLDAPLTLPTSTGSNSFGPPAGSTNNGPPGPAIIGEPVATGGRTIPWGPGVAGAMVFLGAGGIYYIYRRRRVHGGEVTDMIPLDVAIAQDEMTSIVDNSRVVIEPPSTPDGPAFNPSNVDFSGIVLVDPPSPERGVGTGTAGPADEDREITDALRGAESTGHLFQRPPDEKR